jgi:hypothetical protein
VKEEALFEDLKSNNTIPLDDPTIDMLEKARRKADAVGEICISLSLPLSCGVKYMYFC